MPRLPFLLLLIPSLLSVFPRAAVASPPQPIGQTTFSADFISQAQPLIQEQLNLMNRVENALVQPDINRVEAARGQLLLHIGAVERLLQRQFMTPRAFCGNGVSASPEKQIYCSLYASTGQLKPLIPLLERRLPMLAGLAAPQSPQQPLNYRVPATPSYGVLPAFPAPEPPIIGRPAKTPIAEYQPTVQPAIAPPREAAPILQASRQLLTSAIVAFPGSVRFYDSTETRAILERSDYGIPEYERDRYAQTLSQPNTGIARVLPSGTQPTTQLANRLGTNIAQRFPFEPLFAGIGGEQADANDTFTPRFSIQTKNGNFEVAQPNLDYGFLVDVGDVPLEDLDPTLRKAQLLPATREFFLNYQPPQELEAIQVERRRFLTGKDSSIVSRVPAVLNRTYVLRLVQYQLPEKLLTGEPITRAQRRSTDSLLQLSSSDVLVAFRPVKQQRDGSYTVVWRVLNEFPSPEISDLEKYIQFE